MAVVQPSGVAALFAKLASDAAGGTCSSCLLCLLALHEFRSLTLLLAEENGQ